MKTLYLECSMGAAGDMLTAALLELHPNPASFVERLNGMGLPKVRFHAEKAVRCGITGTSMSVIVDGTEEESEDVRVDHTHTYDHTHGHGHTHAHHGMHGIEHIVSHLDIPDEMREEVLAVYRLIAEAESHVHGKPVEEVHFHEVGAMDAVADVAAVCLLIHELAPEQIAASSVHVGSGQVRCAHGILPVPAPATAYLLKDVPTYGGAIQGELCTPTGAALLKHFVSRFAPQPPMRVERIGYGCGKKEFEQANCVRAMLGETEDYTDTILEMQCNLDDMTPEGIGFAIERLFDAGALDVYTTPIGMKKNRPGILLTCMCKAGQREEMLRLLFLHTSTLGVRETVCNRYTLNRTEKTVETAFGPVRFKKSSGWGTTREKPEYEDLARVARNQGISLEQAKTITITERTD